MARLPTPDADLQIRHAQLEQLMRLQLDVVPSRERALVARMRLFRTRGYPPVTGQLSAKRFYYDLDAVVRLSIAFRMIDALVPQEMAPAIIENSWTEIRTAMGKAFRAAGDVEADDPNLAATRPVLVIMPRALASLSIAKADEADGSDGSTPAHEGRAFEARVSDLASVADDLVSAQRDHEFAALTLIDLQRLAGWLRNALLATRWAGPQQFEAYGR